MFILCFYTKVMIAIVWANIFAIKTTKIQSWESVVFMELLQRWSTKVSNV
jgi:hypothetical protein